MTRPDTCNHIPLPSAKVIFEFLDCRVAYLCSIECIEFIDFVWTDEPALYTICTSSGYKSPTCVTSSVQSIIDFVWTDEPALCTIYTSAGYKLAWARLT